MTWDDEGWGARRPLEAGRELATAARAIDAPRLEVPELVTAQQATLQVATPCPRLRAVEPMAGAADLDGAWRRRLERWTEVEALLARAASTSAGSLRSPRWPPVSAAWGGDARSLGGDARAPVEVGGAEGRWTRLEAGVRGAVAAARPRRVIVRGGRRSGKSSNACALAVADATSGTWGISAGDVGLYNIFSARKDQAADRIATCAQIAEALGLKSGVDYRATTQHVVFPKFRTEIRVTVANEASAVSGTSIGGLADEVAHWGSEEKANPAAAILAQFKWSMATNRHALLWIVSAPILTTDPHAVEFDRCRADTLRATIPSYVGNPTLDRDEMWADSEDEIDALRNVEAVPCDVGGGAFYPQALVLRSFGR